MTMPEAKFKVEGYFISIPTIITGGVAKGFMCIKRAEVLSNETRPFVTKWCKKLLGALKAPVWERGRTYRAWWKGSGGLPLMCITPRILNRLFTCNDHRLWW